jgi:hypothetical protein
VEYMGIEFAVRARLDRNRWALTILPKNRGPITLDFIGTRDQALTPRTEALIVGLRIIRRRYPNLRSVDTYHIAPGTALDPRVTAASNCPLASRSNFPAPSRH